MKKKVTSWGKFTNWYDELIEEQTGTYQKELILPNLLRLLELKKNEHVLDLACGQGFFSREFARIGATVTGVDISNELIKVAKAKGSPSTSSGPRLRVEYHVSSANNLSFLRNASFDKAVIVLALQNIENVSGVIKESARVLKLNGKLFLVLNHPAFRIPKASSWGWSEGEKIQYRRIDRYLSESEERIHMHPSAGHSTLATDGYTISFHRPLQFYFKALAKAGFSVTRLEEWNSHKKSEPGPRAAAENRVRAEIPLFLFIKAWNNRN